MSVEFRHRLPSNAPEAGAAEFSPGQRRVAYVMSRFPKLTETFILDEILEQERNGVTVEVFPLWRETAEIVHDDARPIVERAHFTPTLNLAILRDNLRCFASAPLVYLGTLATLLRVNARSARYLIAALAVFPKACSFAERMQALGVCHVHAHFASHPAVAAFVVGRLSGIPWSFTAHGSDLHREQSMLLEKVEEASFVVAISDYNRRFILDQVGERFADKINVIHCGIDPRCYTQGPRTSETLEIACIGTLHEVKGQRFLLEACERLSARGIRWRCHLIGDGPDRGALEAHARGRLRIADPVALGQGLDVMQRGQRIQGNFDLRRVERAGVEPEQSVGAQTDQHIETLEMLDQDRVGLWAAKVDSTDHAIA